MHLQIENVQVVWMDNCKHAYTSLSSKKHKLRNNHQAFFFFLPGLKQTGQLVGQVQLTFSMQGDKTSLMTIMQSANVEKKYKSIRMEVSVAPKY